MEEEDIKVEKGWLETELNERFCKECKKEERKMEVKRNYSGKRKRKKKTKGCAWKSVCVCEIKSVDG